MPARLLTTLVPPPPGFAPTSLAKRELLDGTVVLLLADADELFGPWPDAASRLRGVLVTPGDTDAMDRLGATLWHLRARVGALPMMAEILAVLATLVGDVCDATEEARRRHVELERVREELSATRRDYNQSLAHLGESEERFRALVETSRDWFWSTDTTGRYTYSSPRVRDLLGYEPGEMIGRDFFALMPPDEVVQVEPPYRRAVEARRPIVNLANVNRHRDGRLVTLETSAVPVIDALGVWHGYRGIDRDITERRLAEEQRLQLERRSQHSQKLESLGVLAGGIAHDFNNLLVAVLGNAELALMDMPAGAAGREAVLDIRRAALRASDLTNQLLAYSGKGRFVVEPVDLNALVRDMGRLLSVSISKRAALQYDLAENLPAVEADAAQIRQVVMNLVTNASEAIESAHHDGSITMRTRLLKADRDLLRGTDLGDQLPAGTYIALEIADDGCGMTEDVRQRLFDPFFTTKFQGRGLGMAAVQGIVRGHRGTLTIDTAPDRGTAITVLLPAASAIATEHADEPFATPTTWRGRGTALVVDDDENVLQFTRRVLERQGFTVLTAPNGAEALDLFAGHRDTVVLVVLDLTMPVMDGEETFLALQRLRPGLPVVLASGYNEQDATSRFAGQGLAGFVKKPYRIDELVAAVKTAIEGR